MANEKRVYKYTCNQPGCEKKRFKGGLCYIHNNEKSRMSSGVPAPSNTGKSAKEGEEAESGLAKSIKGRIMILVDMTEYPQLAKVLMQVPPIFAARIMRDALDSLNKDLMGAN